MTTRVGKAPQYLPFLFSEKAKNNKYIENENLCTKFGTKPFSVTVANQFTVQEKLICFTFVFVYKEEHYNIRFFLNNKRRKLYQKVNFYY